MDEKYELRARALIDLVVENHDWQACGLQSETSKICPLFKSELIRAISAEVEAVVAEERARCVAVAREKAGGEPDGTCCNQMWWDACISVAAAIDGDAP